MPRHGTDPKYFDAEEWKAFEKSDQKEWSQWLQNKVVKFLTPEEARRVPREKVFFAPMRVVRTNKAREKLAPLVAKSRLIIPGHLDPEIGSYRTDSPTAATVTTRLVKQVAAARGYDLWSFDVSTAFLSGKATSREIYVRAPPTGLPAAEGQRAVKPLELLQVLKSAYGLTESPLEAKDGVAEIGLKELSASRSVFVASDEKASWALVALHVDDGLVAGRNSDPRFRGLRERINGRFNIKEWHELTPEKPLNFLGVSPLHREKNGLSDRMDRYVADIESPEAPAGSPDTKLNPEQISQLRRLVMKMRWPAQHTMPQCLYPVSYLAQSLTTATVGTFRDAISPLKAMKAEAIAGRARRWYQQMDESEMAVVSFFDASLRKESAGKSQLAAVHFVTSRKVVDGPVPAGVIDFTTNKSTRVACAMAIAADRHLYTRLLLQQLLSGKPEVSAKWREQLAIPGFLTTDAKSLYDHMQTTGQILKERQTLLDLLVCKDLVEGKIVHMKWVLTYKQHADFLTKRMQAHLWEEYSRVGTISLRETASEAVEEERRRGLRRAQRDRRKLRMRQLGPS